MTQRLIKSTKCTNTWTGNTHHAQMERADHEGTIDILYKRTIEWLLPIIRRTTSKMSELPAIAGKYRHQKDVYVEAVKRALKVDKPEFKLIFLRIGKAVSI